MSIFSPSPAVIDRKKRYAQVAGKYSIETGEGTSSVKLTFEKNAWLLPDDATLRLDAEGLRELAPLHKTETTQTKVARGVHTITMLPQRYRRTDFSKYTASEQLQDEISRDAWQAWKNLSEEQSTANDED